jgi:methylenetetrahydrofolate reductase (NADPH)
MANDTIEHLISARKRPLLSFEFFPPKTRDGIEKTIRAAEMMKSASPDFVTITYGAGGSTHLHSFELFNEFFNRGIGLVMPHLTCVGADRAELIETINRFYQRGARNIMALRGDPPEGNRSFAPFRGGLRHASELVTLIKDIHPEICCAVASYPEKHPEAESMDQDILNLKTKLVAGATFTTTQLFFDNQNYFNFVDKCRACGIYHPVIPGILPAVSLRQAHRIAEMCSTRLPPQLEANLKDAEGDNEAMAAVGIQWAANQISKLLAAGVPGIHLYILNRAKTALAPVLNRCFAKYRIP